MDLFYYNFERLIDEDTKDKRAIFQNIHAIITILTTHAVVVRGCAIICEEAEQNNVAEKRPSLIMLISKRNRFTFGFSVVLNKL